MQQITDYRERSKHFLVTAKEELDAGDLEQASEKAWGAAALMVKAVAEQRGYDHDTHNHLFRVLRVVPMEGDNRGSRRELRTMFNVANGLHHNFYEHRLTAEEIAEDIDTVEMFVGRVEQFLTWQNLV